MFRRLRNLVLIALAAALGALIGRWAAEARARVDAGDDPLAVDLHDLNIRPQDFVPGVVAAFRVGEPPWSWLHIPGWLAAFATNFAAAAVGGDLDRLRRMAEDRAMSAFGLESEVEPENDFEIQDVTPQSAAPAEPFTAPAPPPASTATSTEAEPEAPAAPEPQAPPTPEPMSQQPVWTAENATPPPANGNGKAPEAGTPGFTPLRD